MNLEKTIIVIPNPFKAPDQKPDVMRSIASKVMPKTKINAPNIMLCSVVMVQIYRHMNFISSQAFPK